MPSLLVQDNSSVVESLLALEGRLPKYRLLHYWSRSLTHVYDLSSEVSTMVYSTLVVSCLLSCAASLVVCCYITC